MKSRFVDHSNISFTYIIEEKSKNNNLIICQNQNVFLYLK